MSKQLLSVIIPNYNHGHFLPEQLNAILNQSFRPFEIIIIDDASTDDSVKVIQEYAKNNPEIVFYCNEVNQGPIYGLNKGIDLARGDFIYFPSADDRICQGLFEKTMKQFAEHPTAGLCSGLTYVLTQAGDFSSLIRSPLISSKVRFFKPFEVKVMLEKYGFWITGQTMIFRRNAILECGSRFNPDLKQFTDIFLPLVVSIKNGAIFIPETLASWRYAAGYAETNFKDADMTRLSFRQMVQLMRSPLFHDLFTEKFINTYDRQVEYYLINRKIQSFSENAEKILLSFTDLKGTKWNKVFPILPIVRLLFRCQYWLLRINAICNLFNWNLLWGLRYFWGRRRNRFHYEVNDPLTKSSLQRLFS